MGRYSGNDRSIWPNAKKSRLPFASVHLTWCVKINHNSSRAPAWSGLVAIVSALAPASLGVVVGLGVGTMMACAVLLCCCVMSVAVVVDVVVAVFFIVCLCLLARVGVLYHPRGLVLCHAGGASHRRQHCCGSTEVRPIAGSSYIYSSLPLLGWALGWW